VQSQIHMPPTATGHARTCHHDRVRGGVQIVFERAAKFVVRYSRQICMDTINARVLQSTDDALRHLKIAKHERHSDHRQDRYAARLPNH
jgi:hypothetical protein